ncbi:MAG TPA: hypothetical protein VGR35_19470 [Tepidisphaeraceae bacterium]|nr:hypothetical protein [Tepidisphaeraceae bacterium]
MGTSLKKNRASGRRAIAHATGAVVEALEDRKLLSTSLWVAMGGLARGAWYQSAAMMSAQTDGNIPPEGWFHGPTGVAPGESKAVVAHGPLNPHVPIMQVAHDETGGWVLGPTGVPEGKSVKALSHGPSNPHVLGASVQLIEPSESPIETKGNPDLELPTPSSYTSEHDTGNGIIITTTETYALSGPIFADDSSTLLPLT